MPAKKLRFGPTRPSPTRPSLTRPKVPTAALASNVEQWFLANARTLPWRFSRDPYAIWVSEIMLQQTRVDTVIPRYERFMERFPTLEALADASLNEVRSEWAGLGYYRRCQNLWKGARFVVDDLDGAIPSSPAELKKIPGVGPYTAAAIAALAFNAPVAAVDGNVLRVLGRVLGKDLPTDSPDLRRAVQAFGDELAAKGKPSLLAQALMEIGAILCRPKSTQCPACPLNTPCLARQSGHPTRIPRPARRRAPHQWSGVVVVAVDPGGRVLLERRPERGLLAGLWMPPARIGDRKQKEIVEALKAPKKAVEEILGQAIQKLDLPARATWRFTHILLEPLVIRAHCPTLTPGPGQAVKTMEEWSQEAVPSATFALLSAVGAEVPPKHAP